MGLCVGTISFVARSEIDQKAVIYTLEKLVASSYPQLELAGPNERHYVPNKTNFGVMFGGFAMWWYGQKNAEILIKEFLVKGYTKLESNQSGAYNIETRYEFLPM